MEDRVKPIASWLQKNSYRVYSLALLLMLLPALALYWAAQGGSLLLMGLFLALVVVGNFLAVLTR